MNLTPLVNLLEAANLGVKGKTLFDRMLPAECQQGVLLRSPLAGTKINPELPGFYQPDFQVIVRSVGYDDGEALMTQVMDALTFGERVVDTQTFQYCRPLMLPVAFPLSRGNLVEHTVQFRCAYTQA